MGEVDMKDYASALLRANAYLTFIFVGVLGFPVGRSLDLVIHVSRRDCR